MIPLSLKFLGVKITTMGREEIKEFLIQTVYEKGKFRVMFLDEEKLFSLLFKKEQKEIVNGCEIVLCSSQTVAWMVKVFTGKNVPVIMPVTIFLDFMRIADEMNYTAFLFGGDQNVSLETMKRIRKSFPQARIIGNYRSNIKNKELDDVLLTIRKSSPQIFFAGYGGAMKQEKWLSANQSYFPNSIIVGVDSAFQIIAGKKKMPPLWFQQKEWNGFYSFLMQPYNIARIFRIATLFFITIYYKLTKKDASA